MRAAAALLAASLAIAAACGCKRGGGSDTDTVAVERGPLGTDDVRGISGLTRGEDGALWLVPERDRELVRRGADGGLSILPIEGVERGIDLESVAHLGGDQIAFGAERNVALGGEVRAQPVLIARIIDRDGESRVVVHDRIELALDRWQMEFENNEGIEGLCRAGGFLVAGVETVGGEGDRRFAPIGVYDLAREKWTPYRLMLTTPTGSVSALACRMSQGRVEIFAVERHFGVLRVLRALLPEEPGEVMPDTVADLDAFAKETGLNVEGLELGDEGELLMAVDNQYRGVQGPNELVTLRGAL